MIEASRRAGAGIVLTRIDNRLLHAQVTCAWNAKVHADLIVVANDETALDGVRRRIMAMAAPAGTEAEFLTLEDAAAQARTPRAGRRILLIVATPQDALALVRAGVEIRRLNVGNMSMAEGKRMVASAVAVDDADVEAFRALRSSGARIEVRSVPAAKREPSAGLFELSSPC